MQGAVSFEAIQRTNLGISAAVVTLSLVLAPPLFTLSLVLGAALETLNFRGLYRGARAALLPEDAPVGSVGVMGPRLGLLAVAVGAALTFGAHPVGLVIGLSLVMPAAVIEAWRVRPRVDPNAPSLDEDDESWERWNPWLARERDESDDEDLEALP